MRGSQSTSRTVESGSWKRKRHFQ